MLCSDTATARPQPARMCKCGLPWPEPSAPQQLRKLGIADAFSSRLEGDIRRENMMSAGSHAIETLDGQRVAIDESNRLRRCCANARLDRERHRGVFNQRRV